MMNGEFDLKAIAFFCASGFFPDRHTYLTGKEYEYPSTSPFHKTFEEFSNFQWRYEPSEISLADATDKFAILLESLVDAGSNHRNVILPLSGGLDSRTLAAALKRTGKNVTSYSYSFRNGHNETRYGEKIAGVYGFPFRALTVQHGYLWNVIEQLATMNQCFSEFTHPRQMAFTGEYASMGDVFALGHWGDVLFDDMGVDDNLLPDDILKIIIKKISKKGGPELAKQLWKAWNLEGSFEDYYHDTVHQMLNKVLIKNSANATIRAFKSKYWATRWTASNFCIFESAKPIMVPYFETEMCRFVCSLPESLLKGRQIQIAYLKKYAPEIASITWQAHKPFNLYNYNWNRQPYNLPYRAIKKVERSFNRMTGKALVQRNWELQFTGDDNKQKLSSYIFDNPKLSQLIPDDICKVTFRNFFENEPVQFAHPLSTLLTISLYLKLFRN